MKKIFIFVIVLILNYSLGYATLTPGTIPVTKTGGSTPVLQNGSITDTGTSSGGGNVGIGTPTPTSLLQVYGGGIGISGSSTPSYITGVNLGVGSTNPGQQLDVFGTARMTGFQLNLVPLAGGNVLVSNSVGIGTWMPPSSIGAGGGSMVYPSGTGIPVVSSGTSWVTTISNGSGYLNNNGSGSYSWSTPAGATNYWVEAAGNQGIGTAFNVGISTLQPSALLDIENTSTAVFNNLANVAFNNLTSMTTSGINVGINSASPGELLDVAGSVRLTQFNMPTGASNTYVLTSDSNGNGTWQAATGGGGKNYWLTNGALGIGTYSPFNVGIGTISPNAAFTVGSTNQFQVGSNGSILALTGDGNANLTSQELSLDSSGNVAVVNQNTGSTSSTDLSGGSGASSYVQITSTSKATGAVNDNIQFLTNGTSAPHTTMIIQNNSGTANVGIGTVAPTGALEIENGNVGIGTWGVPSGGTGFLVNGNEGIGTSFIGGANEGALTVMNGNVGIGTWIPAQILNVNGGVQVNGSGNSGIGTFQPTGTLEVEGGNVGIGTNVEPDVLSVGGGVAFRGNLAGGVTGNVGIGTTQTATGATCDSSCNTASKRCFGGMPSSGGFEPCSVSIIGDCICLPAT